MFTGTQECLTITQAAFHGSAFSVFTNHIRMTRHQGSAFVSRHLACLNSATQLQSEKFIYLMRQADSWPPVVVASLGPAVRQSNRTFSRRGQCDHCGSDARPAECSTI